MIDTDLLYIFFALCVLLLLVVLWLTYKLIKIDRMKKEFFASGSNKDLEQILIDHNRALTKLATDLKHQEDSLENLYKENENNFQKFGFVRFNPFDDSGGNVSFALALLDAHNDGLVISSLHGREGTRVYSKTIKAGKSESKLTDEEQQAIKIAN